eukprot:11594482-Alexandrium_andersonii.AAC.1
MRPHLPEKPNAATYATPSDTTRNATSPGEAARGKSAEATNRQDARATRQCRNQASGGGGYSCKAIR